MMTSTFIILIPITLIVIVIIAVIFWRALHSGQFDDLDTPSQTLLNDDDNNNEIVASKQTSSFDK